MNDERLERIEKLLTLIFYELAVLVGAALVSSVR